MQQIKEPNISTAYKARASTIQTQHSALGLGATPMVKNWSSTNSGSPESPIISEDMKLETLQGPAMLRKEAHCLMMLL